MRLLLLSILTTVGGLYCYGAFTSYREEQLARNTLLPLGVEEIARHPEANLRVLREAFASNNYADELAPLLNRTISQAPSFYQPPFLLAAFYANRLEKPETVRASFELSLLRFPSNGRLHLTYAEWLVTPRATAPYRIYRAESTDGVSREERDVALDHVEKATSLESELTREALRLLLRMRIPSSQWAERLPREAGTNPLLLEAMDRAPRDKASRRALLEELLTEEPGDLVELRSLTRYAIRWDEAEIAFEAATRWYAKALEAALGDDLPTASIALVAQHLERGENDAAYEAIRATVTTMEERGLPQELTIELLTGIASIYANARRWAMAQSFLVEAATLSPYDVRPLLGLAQVHRALGENEEAIAKLERVLELDPSNARARLELDRLLEESLSIPRR